MKQLECDEHYELCTMFKSMFDSMNLNKEYLRWTKKITPNGDVLGAVIKKDLYGQS